MRHLIERIEGVMDDVPLTEAARSYNDFVQEATASFLSSALPIIRKSFSTAKNRGGKITVWSKDNAAGLKYIGQDAAGNEMQWWCQLVRESMFSVRLTVRWLTDDGTHDYTFDENVHDLVPQTLLDEFTKAFNGTA